MKRKRFSVEQIVAVLKQAEVGQPWHKRSDFGARSVCARLPDRKHSRMENRSRWGEGGILKVN